MAPAAAAAELATEEPRILGVSALRPWPAAEERLLSSLASRASGAALAGFTSWLSGIARGLGVVVVVVLLLLGGRVPEVEAGWFEVRSRVRFLCSSMLQRQKTEEEGERKRGQGGAREKREKKMNKEDHEEKSEVK